MTDEMNREPEPIREGYVEKVPNKELLMAALAAEQQLLDEEKGEETIVVDEKTGGKKGAKNIRLHAAPWEALAELGRVFAFGEDKYDDYNFRKGYRWSLSFDALQRHVWLFWNREDKDAESKLHHMAHAAWHALVLCFYSLTGRGTDDRPE